jgi:hypothetical protein
MLSSWKRWNLPGVQPALASRVSRPIARYGQLLHFELADVCVSEAYLASLVITVVRSGEFAEIKGWMWERQSVPRFQSPVRCHSLPSSDKRDFRTYHCSNHYCRFTHTYTYGGSPDPLCYDDRCYAPLGALEQEDNCHWRRSNRRRLRRRPVCARKDIRGATAHGRRSDSKGEVSQLHVGGPFVG